MTFLVVTSTGSMWPSPCPTGGLKPSEKALLDSGAWKSVEVYGDNMIKQALLGHCRYINGNVTVIPVEDWPHIPPGVA